MPYDILERVKLASKSELDLAKPHLDAAKPHLDAAKSAAIDASKLNTGESYSLNEEYSINSFINSIDKLEFTMSGGSRKRKSKRRKSRRRS